MEQFQYPFFNKSVLVSYTDEGVTQISFRNKKVARPSRTSKVARKIQKILDAYLTDEAPMDAMPIDWENLEGTDFQKKVWKKMSKIPYGKTKTYGEIAKSLKSPGAARAVGTACAKNPVLLAIPCHRVVGSTGLGGFSGGGLPVKRKLLDLENTTY